mmetsp:Transcript_25834/g.39595  ORF Transcript_25834/g.39595 Transcript_25834/m.39595 type:complete len:1065 (+) Transcript_25834:180-3374(+)
MTNEFETMSNSMSSTDSIGSSDHEDQHNLSSQTTNSQDNDNDKDDDDIDKDDDDIDNDNDNDNDDRNLLLNSISRVTSAQSNPSLWHKLTICNPCRSECGYCHGDRAHVLTQNNPAIFPSKSEAMFKDIEPQVVIFPVAEEAMRGSGLGSGSGSDSNGSGEEEKKQQSHSQSHNQQSKSNGHNNPRQQMNRNSQGHGSNDGGEDDDSNANDNVIITKETSSDAYCVHFHNISPHAYLKLINNGWRRSGNLLYLPKNWQSCCACYPIRLDTTPGVFRCSKSQKKVLKKFQRALDTGCVNSNVSASVDTNTCTSSSGGEHARRIYENDHINGHENKDNGNGNTTFPKKNSFNTKRQKRHVEKDASKVIAKNPFKSIAKELLLGTPSNFKDGSSRSNKSTKKNCTLVPLIQEGIRSQVDQVLEEQMQLALSNNRAEDDISIRTLKENDVLLEKLCTVTCSKICKPRENNGDSNTSVAAIPTLKRLHSLDPTANPTTTSTTSIEIILSNKICPALSGKSKGLIDRFALGKTIVDAFQHDCCIAGYRWDSSDSNKNDIQQQYSDSVTVQSIELHKKSGHLNVHVNIVRRCHTAATCTSNRNGADTQRNGVDANVATSSFKADVDDDAMMSKTEDETDIFAEFIQRSDAMHIDIDKTNVDTAFDEPTNTTSMPQRRKYSDAQSQSTPNPSFTLPSQQNLDLQPPYRLTVKNFPSHVSGCMPQVHRLYCKYQSAIHKDEDPFAEKVKYHEGKSNYTRTSANKAPAQNNGDKRMHIPLKEHDMATLYPECNRFQRTKILKSYNDFFRFLCSSPLSLSNEESKIPTTNTESSTKRQLMAVNGLDTSPFDFEESDVNIPYGSYHQHYLMNDKYLMAVGVVDILPNCVSSVYSFYDPELSSVLNLGKLTALYEIDWVKNASIYRADLKYYVLGYYIHSCQKMKYKAEYKPSELLCPSRAIWTPYEIAKKRIEERSPLRNCCDISSTDEELRKIIYVTPCDETSCNLSEMNEYNKHSDDQIDNVNDIIFDIGQGPFMTLDMNMLSKEGQAIIRPILKDFVDEVGVALSRECIIKLC